MLDALRDAEDEELQTQLDVFYEWKEGDDESLSADKPHGLDINSHQDLFNGIMQKVNKIVKCRLKTLNYSCTLFRAWRGGGYVQTSQARSLCPGKFDNDSLRQPGK